MFGDRRQSRGLDIYFIDVQGGAATLIVTPERESILIDSGWPGLEDRDPKRIVHVLKDLAGCDHLDHLITTHWHMDHFGGVGGLAKLIEIKHFWDRGLPDDGDARLDFPDGPKADDPLGIAYREASKGKRTALKAGDSLPFRGRPARASSSPPAARSFRRPRRTPAEPALRRCARRPAGRSLGQCAQPGDPVPASASSTSSTAAT